MKMGRTIWMTFGAALAALWLAAVSHAAVIDGTPANDLLQGTTSYDTIHGYGGNDIIVGGLAVDSLFGDEGNDLFIWNEGDGSDFIEGGSEADVLQVNLHATLDDDVSIAPNGARLFVRRANLATFSLDVGTIETLDINGGGGHDRISGLGFPAGLFLDLSGEAGNDQLTGGDGGDVLRGGDDRDTLLGSGGNDVLLGEDGDDLFVWADGDGSDFVEGGAGFDTLQVDGSPTAADEFLIDSNGGRVRLRRTNLAPVTLDVGTTERIDLGGGGGDDEILVGFGLSTLVALDLDGGDGDDTLFGSSGSETLRGGAGHDLLIGDRGADVLNGGPGQDIFIWYDGDGSDFVDGGSDSDLLQMTLHGTLDDEVSITPSGSRVRIQRNHPEFFALDVGAMETLYLNGSGGNDTLSGAPGLAPVSLRLDGSAGNDLLFGGDGDDVLDGGTGDDILLGGDGADTLRGGADVNVHQGGGGADRFVLDAGAYDEITDYEPGEQIDVRGVFDGALPNVVPGDDLFALGMLAQWTDGADTAIGFPSSAEAVRINGVVGTFASDPSDPFVVFLPEPGATLQLASGLLGAVWLGRTRERLRRGRVARPGRPSRSSR